MWHVPATINFPLLAIQTHSEDLYPTLALELGKEYPCFLSFFCVGKNLGLSSNIFTL